jgi:hypothetical protein
MPGQLVFNLSVSWDRLLQAAFRIKIDIVPGTMSMKNATRLGQTPDKFLAPHTVISLTRKSAGTSSKVI